MQKKRVTERYIVGSNRCALVSSLLLTPMHQLRLQGAGLTALDSDEIQYFGNAVSLSGDIALIGAPFNKHNAIRSGSAYLFRGSLHQAALNETAKLTPEIGTDLGIFALSVSASGTNALIGNYRSEKFLDWNNTVYLFREMDTATGSSIHETAKLVGSDLQNVAGLGFGLSVSLSGNTAIVGDSFNVHNGVRHGAAYLYRDINSIPAGSVIEEDAKLIPSDGIANGFFGTSVSHSGNMALIRAYQDDDQGSGSRSCHLIASDDKCGNTLP